jgi:hypothetical protein
VEQEIWKSSFTNALHCRQFMRLTYSSLPAFLSHGLPAHEVLVVRTEWKFYFNTSERGAMHLRFTSLHPLNFATVVQKRIIPAALPTLLPYTYTYHKYYYHILDNHIQGRGRGPSTYTPKSSPSRSSQSSSTTALTSSSSSSSTQS